MAHRFFWRTFCYYLSGITLIWVQILERFLLIIKRITPRRRGNFTWTISGKFPIILLQAKNDLTNIKRTLSFLRIMEPEIPPGGQLSGSCSCLRISRDEDDIIKQIGNLFYIACCDRVNQQIACSASTEIFDNEKWLKTAPWTILNQQIGRAHV